MSWHSAHGRVMLFIDSKPFTTISYHWDIDIYRFPSSDNRKEFWVHALKEPDNGSSFAFERFYVTGMSGGLIHRLIMFPLWLPTLLLSLWPAIALTRHIKRRYFSPGICRNCGYDLRGTPSGVCPECGRTSNVPPDKESTPAKIEA